MKHFIKFFYCDFVMGLGLMLFSLIAETDFSDTLVVKFAFADFALPLNWFILVFGTFMFSVFIFLVNLICYDIFYYKNVPNRLRNEFGFLLVLLLKYALPTFLIWSVTIGGVSVLEEMPVTSFIFRAFMSISLVLDLVVFSFKFSGDDVITIKFGSKTFVYPCRKIHNYLTMITWGIFAVSVGKVYKTKIDSSKHSTLR